MPHNRGKIAVGFICNSKEKIIPSQKSIHSDVPSTFWLILFCFGCLLYLSYRNLIGGGIFGVAVCPTNTVVLLTDPAHAA